MRPDTTAPDCSIWCCGSRVVLSALDRGGAEVGSGPLSQPGIPVRSSPLHRDQQGAGYDTARRGEESSDRGDVRAGRTTGLAQPGLHQGRNVGGQRAPDRKRRALHQAEIGARAGPIWHYVAQDQPLHGVVGGCALSSEGVCILGFRPDLHRVQGAVATWVKTGENPAAARRAGGKRGGMQGPCGCARGTPFSVGGLFLQRFHPTPALRGTTSFT